MLGRWVNEEVPAHTQQWRRAVVHGHRPHRVLAQAAPLLSMLADSRLPCLLEEGTSSLVPMLLPLLQLLGCAGSPPSKAQSPGGGSTHRQVVHLTVPRRGRPPPGTGTLA